MIISNNSDAAVEQLGFSNPPLTDTPPRRLPSVPQLQERLVLRPRPLPCPPPPPPPPPYTLRHGTRVQIVQNTYHFEKLLDFTTRVDICHCLNVNS
ncbi:hypothetical protein K435DRAFT_863870 [Dendrothele bispora CBS 962.96]|uniref:Uncharacterized protein n=1 Tax=Dendrothele bispora (strain CBS 962.96) TaxID=1314807 RepID=A0A4S8LNM1_DENBC|nr:hypothetical protein K435DRAFT_863870 [Dendrothele bispora CBS 962.96]